jgi:hypothetical protein
MGRGKGYGTGSPLSFRCWRCRRNDHDWENPGREGRIVHPTGRTKKRGHSSARHGTVSREYKCPDCGYVGWSSHNDLTRKYMTTKGAN